MRRQLLMTTPFVCAALALFAAENAKFLYFVAGFVGASPGGRSASGPAGVVAIHKTHGVYLKYDKRMTAGQAIRFAKSNMSTGQKSKGVQQ